MKRLITLLLVCSALAGCAAPGTQHPDRYTKPASDTDAPDTDTQSAAPITYEQITPADAKALMDSAHGYIILDVRTEEEFAQGHIEGALLIPDYEITAKAERMLPDKNQLILVYCRSGRRSKLAAEALVELGYTNVKEFGGIIDWPYSIVTESNQTP